MGGQIDLISVDENHIVATWRNVAIVVWRQETRAESVRHLRKVIEQLGSTHRSSVGLLQVVEDGCRKLDTAAREELDALFLGAREHVKCSSVLFEGEGFKAAVVRSVVAGIALLTRTHFPHHVFARAGDMANFMARRLMDAPDPRFATNLCDALREARGVAEARVPSVRPRRRHSMPPPRVPRLAPKR